MPGLGRKTFTAGDVLTASQVQGYLQDQTIMVFAGTAARSSAISSPSEGMFTITTNDDELDYYNGTAWVTALPIGAWTTYTPTINAATTNPTLSGTTFDCAFAQYGKTVHVRIKITLATVTSAGSGAWIFSLPVTSKSGTEAAISGIYIDTSLSNVYRIVARMSSDQINRSYISDGGTGFLSNSNPVVPATGDIYIYSFTYEAA